MTVMDLVSFMTSFETIIPIHMHLQGSESETFDNPIRIVCGNHNGNQEAKKIILFLIPVQIGWLRN